MNDSSKFWKQRLVKHGHTGWADPIIYAYDQQERLALVGGAIKKLQIQRGNALDFGCGTGDFSRQLIEMGFMVCGYDPFVKPQIHSNTYSYTSNLRELSCNNKTADLILSVTALDHILDDNELGEALDIIQGCLKPEGFFCMLEYALDAETDREKFGLHNDYQAFRTLAQWAELLDQHSFRIVEAFSVPHPRFGPSPGYIAYNRTWLVRISRRFSKALSLAKTWRDAMLKKQAAKCVSTFPIDLRAITSTPLKLIRCSPVC